MSTIQAIALKDAPGLALILEVLPAEASLRVKTSVVLIVKQLYTGPTKIGDGDSLLQSYLKQASLSVTARDLVPTS